MLRWSLWAQGHIEPWVQKDLLLADLITAIGDRANSMVYQSLGVLERALNGQPWLLGEYFTVGDLNVAAVLSPSRSRALNLSANPRVSEWLERCYARPGAVEVRKLLQG